MPELPEVEVTRRAIEKRLVGRRIRKVTTTRPSYFFLTEPSLLARRLRGRCVERLDRHGKYLVGTLDDGSRLLFHLGMTGQLFVSGARSLRLLRAARHGAPGAAPPVFEPDEHTHLVLSFSDGPPDLYFRDVRKFGKCALLAKGRDDARLEKLGVDALSATGSDLFRASRGRRAAVKTLLLEQSVIAGIGNIYADEALFLSGVRPTRMAGRVSERECAIIVRSVRRVLLRAIARGGSSIDDFVRPDGSDGGYQNERRVYARTGEPCPRCAAPIRRVVLGARSAHYCLRCQR
jgi:formamidopyrimidine-DNA glycosylase